MRPARLRLCLKLRQRQAFRIQSLSKAGPGAARPWRVWAAPSLASCLPALAKTAALALLAALAPSPARAAPEAILSPPPGLAPSVRAEYARFLDDNLPRAFALSPDGRAGRGIGDTPALARDAALASCARSAPLQAAATPAQPCTLWADGLSVVAPGRESAPPPPPATLRDTWNYTLAPDPRFLWHGSAEAAGVVLWAHGRTTGQDSRGVQPPPLLRPFNNAGLDIVRLDREPFADDRDRAAGWMRDSLALLRRLGYRRVVAAGQSRGAWNALQSLDTPGLADAVIALSPAAQGSAAGTNLGSQDDELRRLVRAAAPSATRLAVAQFADDPFAADEDDRARRLAALRPTLGAVLLIDRPPGLRGHGAGLDPEFAARFSACLLRFATAPDPPAACP